MTKLITAVTITAFAVLPAIAQASNTPEAAHLPKSANSLHYHFDFTAVMSVVEVNLRHPRISADSSVAGELHLDKGNLVLSTGQAIVTKVETNHGDVKIPARRAYQQRGDDRQQPVLTDRQGIDVGLPSAVQPPVTLKTVRGYVPATVATKVTVLSFPLNKTTGRWHHLGTPQHPFDIRFTKLHITDHSYTIEADVKGTAKSQFNHRDVNFASLSATAYPRITGVWLESAAGKKMTIPYSVNGKYHNGHFTGTIWRGISWGGNTHWKGAKEHYTMLKMRVIENVRQKKLRFQLHDVYIPAFPTAKPAAAAHPHAKWLAQTPANAAYAYNWQNISITVTHYLKTVAPNLKKGSSHEQAVLIGNLELKKAPAISAVDFVGAITHIDANGKPLFNDPTCKPHQMKMQSVNTPLRRMARGRSAFITMPNIIKAGSTLDLVKGYVPAISSVTTRTLTLPFNKPTQWLHLGTKKYTLNIKFNQLKMNAWNPVVKAQFKVTNKSQLHPRDRAKPLPPHIEKMWLTDGKGHHRDVFWDVKFDPQKHLGQTTGRITGVDSAGGQLVKFNTLHIQIVKKEKLVHLTFTLRKLHLPTYAAAATRSAK